jgi:signal transduction histidine kinase
LVADGDPPLIRLVLENLFGNAFKFTGRTPEPRIEFGVEPDTRPTVFFVRDNGAGFDMRFADQLFGPFQRLHSNSEFEGTGIGLATVQRIVHRHGGWIRGEGSPGRGATFRFTLEAGLD